MYIRPAAGINRESDKSVDDIGAIYYIQDDDDDDENRASVVVHILSRPYNNNTPTAHNRRLIGGVTDLNARKTPRGP